MAQSHLDHLVVTARNLAAGVAWAESILGVAFEKGGEHARMATHNALLRLGDSTYLEVIAPDPAASPPRRPRWFDLDRLAPDSEPRLATWVARCDDVRSVIEDCGYRYGPVEEMSRGRFSWRITVPPDGTLPGGGAIPTLIQWTVDDHPAAGLADQGCRLSRLEVFTPDATLTAGLVSCLGLRVDVRIRELPADRVPYLVAEIETPRGPTLLGASVR